LIYEWELNFGMLMFMGKNRNAMRRNQKGLPSLLLMQLALLLGAVFLGLFSMHILIAPSMSPNGHPSTHEHEQLADHAIIDSQIPLQQDDDQHGCSTCPMNHELSAVGCILALLALLLVLRPPGLRACRKKFDLRLIVLLRDLREQASTKPDLTALGISRT